MIGSNGASFVARAAGLALLLAGEIAAQQSPFGLRNTEKLPASWTSADFGTEFGGHGAGHLAFWLFWGEVQAFSGKCEPRSGPFDLSVLDERLAFAQSIGADPVIVFHAAGGFGSPVSAFEGMRTEPQTCPPEAQDECYTGPCDLDLVSELEWPPEGLPKGYSTMLYDVVYAVAEHMAASLDPGTTVRFRFHNEAWSEWPIGSTTEDREENLDNYLRSYLTARLAVEDAEAAAQRSGVQFLVGHGSIPRGRLVPSYYYELGELDPLDGGPPPTGIKQWAMQRLNSFTERNRSFVETKYGIDMPINTWQEAAAYAGPGTYNNLLDAWMNRFVAWTAAGYFEFTTQHPHDKPYFIREEQELFEERVAAVEDALPAPPWFAAEAAFELLDEEGWGVYSFPSPQLETFMAEDYVRKWCTLLAHDTPFCSPIIGGPHPSYVGLYEPQGENPAGCIEGICPLPSNDAFVFLSGQIGSHLPPVEDLSAGANVHYRFDPDDPTDPRRVDVIWRRTLFDSGSGTSSVTVTPPDGYPDWNGYNVFGDQLLPGGSGSVQLPNLGQPPRVIVWRP